MYEFRLLKGFKKLFETETNYRIKIDQYKHGFERILAFSEVRKVESKKAKFENHVEITINVIDSQMINHFTLNFK